MAPDLKSPIQQFQADFRFNKMKSASVVQRMVGYRILGSWGHSATHFAQIEQRMCPGKIRSEDRSPDSKQPEQSPAQTSPGGAVCRGGRRILWSPAVSGRNVTGWWNLFCIKWPALVSSIVWPMHLWAWNKSPEIGYTFGHLLMITLYMKLLMLWCCSSWFWRCCCWLQPCRLPILPMLMGRPPANSVTDQCILYSRSWWLYVCMYICTYISRAAENHLSPMENPSARESFLSCSMAYANASCTARAISKMMKTSSKDNSFRTAVSGLKNNLKPV